jgi:hypothetical protein
MFRTYSFVLMRATFLAAIVLVNLAIGWAFFSSSGLTSLS